jgi:hypothetical protein
MKFKVSWSSPRQGIQSTNVDALNSFAAQEQVESMYAHIDGFRFISTSPVFEKKDVESSYNSERSYSSSSSSASGDDFSTMIASGAFLIAAGAILLGLFTLPLGIGAMLIGGAIGWLGWKLAGWLSDRGW